MQILEYANNYFAATLTTFVLLILRSGCAVVKLLSLRNFLLSHIMCHSTITSQESSEQSSAAGSKSGSERGLRGWQPPRPEYAIATMSMSVIFPKCCYPDTVAQ